MFVPVQFIVKKDPKVFEFTHLFDAIIINIKSKFLDLFKKFRVPSSVKNRVFVFFWH